jgi:pilus assembly protein CpaB
MLRVVNFPTVSVPTSSFRTVEQVIPAGAPPRVAMREFVANEPLVAAKLSGPGSKANLAGALTPGMRAVGVRVTDVAGVGGFVLPGDRVDVMVTREVGAGANVSSVVQVLAENSRVLGVDQSSEAEEPVVAKAVTLEVTPDQAQSISLAQAVGAVTLALRQAADGAPLSRRSMTVSDLGGVRAPGPVRRRAAAPRTQIAQVRVTRGVEISGYPMPN